jgi:oxygen-dependent protoporphyrinogen oxidase
MIWVSSIFPPHAPEGHVSLRVLFGGARDPAVVDLTDGELEDIMLREMGGLLEIRGKPVARRVYRYARGIPQYNLGHGGRLERIGGFLAELPGLFLAGNSYRGIGINDSVLAGVETARAAFDFLSRPPGS